MRYAAILIALALGGCATQGATESLTPVCAALGKPIVSNPNNPKSHYYAADLLEKQIAVKNRVGINLNCPSYR